MIINKKNKSEKRQYASLWIAFASLTFIVQMVIIILIVLIAVFLFHKGFFTPRNGMPLAPILILIVISLCIGCALSLLVGRLFLKPMKLLSDASIEVAKGNFNISLPDESRVRDVSTFIQNFNKMTRELSGIETLRSDFIANVSHEFKTPLSAIEGYASLLQTPGLSFDEHLEYTQMIIDSTRQLSTLTENILSLSKLENQEVLPVTETFRLDENIREAIVMLEGKWTKKNIDLQIKLDKVTITSSANLLKQVWINLIDNAVKFTPNGGRVELLLKEDNVKQQVIFSITDSGIGMSPDEIKHIFDKFYQSDKARTDNGNGLGLALVKRIVTLLDGNISVYSTDGTGTTVIIVL